MVDNLDVKLSAEDGGYYDPNVRAEIAAQQLARVVLGDNFSLFQYKSLYSVFVEDCAKNLDAPKRDAYFTELAKNLEDMNVLPRLMLRIVGADFDEFDTNGDEQISHGEVDAAVSAGPDPLKKAVAQSLKDHFDWMERQGSEHADAVTRKHVAKVMGVEAALAPMLQSINGGTTLFETLDDLPGGKDDGKVGEEDLERYLREYEIRGSSDRYALTSCLWLA